eukprot:1226276-Prymnesium_polylepis.2
MAARARGVSAAALICTGVKVTNRPPVALAHIVHTAVRYAGTRCAGWRHLNNLESVIAVWVSNEQ